MEQEMGYGYVKNDQGRITTDWLQEGTYEIGTYSCFLTSLDISVSK
jgi:hypothetical protein